MTNGKIYVAVTEDDCREISAFLTKEMSEEVFIPRLPGSARESETVGELFGYRENGHLVGAAFCRPLHEEAEAVIRNPVVEPGVGEEVYSWLTDRAKMIELVATSTAHRRKGIAAKLLRTIESLAVDDGCDVLLAVTKDSIAANLFAQQGYFVYKPLVSLMLTAQQADGMKLLGQIPGLPDTFHALKEVGRCERFSFGVHHPAAMQRQDGNPVIRSCAARGFRIY